MAERVLLSRTEPGRLTVASAGTYDLAGHEMDAQAAVVTRELGADPAGHAAREVTAQMIESADLVLGATQDHRDHVLRLVPRALRRTFTLREFTRLGSSVPPPQDASAQDASLLDASPLDASPLDASPRDSGLQDADLRSRISDIAARRGLADPPAAGADDIGDPYGGTIQGMRACGAVISVQVDEVIRLLGLTPSTQT